MRLDKGVLRNLLCGMEITDLAPRERMNPFPVLFDQGSERTFIARQDALNQINIFVFHDSPPK